MHKAVKNLTEIVKKGQNCGGSSTAVGGMMFHLNLIVFQSCQFKGNVLPKKASMEGEMKNLEESRRLAK